MNKFGKWETVREMNPGAQGRVYLVRDSQKVPEDALRDGLLKALAVMNNPTQNREPRHEAVKKFLDDLKELSLSENPSSLGVLKILPEARAGWDRQKAIARMEQEIAILEKVKHPHILKILDASPHEGWFVAQYYPRGSLSENRHIFQGNVLGALEGIRPLVEAVAALHEENLVHRDIKPDNIFLDHDGHLILGDFGLVFSLDDNGSRLTDTFENVGSWQWMPQWAMGQRLDEVKPNVDVYGLGKVLWAMISNKRNLTLWYYDRPDFDLEKMFPNNPDTSWANDILKRCIVEYESACLGDAGKLRELLDPIIAALRRHAQVVKEGRKMNCTVCGLGEYLPALDDSQHPRTMEQFGLQAQGNLKYKIFVCRNCGHTQLFNMTFWGQEKHPAWTR